MSLATFKKPVDAVIATLTVTVMVALVGCVVWQVFSRYVLSEPSTITDELARYAMIWVGLLGAAYTVGLQQHLAIDLITDAMGARDRAAMGVLINAVVVAFALLVITRGGLGLIDKSLASGQLSPAMRIPMGYVYFVLPISGVVMSYYCALFCIGHLIDLCRPDRHRVAGLASSAEHYETVAAQAAATGPATLDEQEERR
ncbi:TRAP-type C4-dicarboxylate transport system permease small subunit [Kushneria sinocarnis]|uniref:TRAP transporter small permease protein n=1 Tax=Kushneria sinocarnis TaxID=595502 RepID=A0A420WW93_9GAMM|nr:TRAP transporter small permease [Kushneria sinocarnis]RKR03396.1 TRAP-type C4-dicarboxylate transport system permease small subunit [Kushneria sinocarnis]